jgi:hypothetical protein
VTYVKCAGCGEIIEIPDELRGDCPDGDITDALGEPYYCVACERGNEEYYPFEELYP